MNPILKRLSFGLPAFCLVFSGCVEIKSQLELAENDSIEFDLMTVKSDFSNTEFTIRGAMDQDQNLYELRFRSQQGIDYMLRLDELGSGKVIYEYQDLEVAAIYSENFMPDSGGLLRIRYLKNAVTGSYENFKFTVSKTDSGWALFTQDGDPKKFKGLFLKVKKFLGQPIGIAEVIPQP